MKLTKLFLRLCCLSVISILSYEAEARKTNPQPKKQTRIQLSSAITEQHYCSETIDAQHNYPKLRLKIKLTLKNLDAKPIIVYRYGGSITSVLVSKNISLARSNHHVYEAWLTPIPLSKLADRDFVESAPTDEFAIVKSGETHNFEYAYDVDISLRDLSAPKWKLKPGDYLFQIVTQTWSWQSDKANQLKTKWSQYGDFWYYDLKSEPLPIKIEEPGSVLNPCK